jgi:hypothetical protein
MTESTELLDYEALLAGMAQEAAKTERPSTSTISFRSGILAYNKQPVPGNNMDCIVIASNHSNKLYKGAYDPDNIANPDCYAYSPDGLDMVPHPSVAEPICDNCTTCPANQWKSQGMFGGRTGAGKACKNGRSLVLIPASTKPEEVGDAEVAIAHLPVTSGQNWSTYVNKLATLFNRPPLGMVTKISVVPDLKSQFKATFTNVAPVDVSMLRPLIDRAKTVDGLLVREYEANVEAPAEVDNGKKKKF